MSAPSETVSRTRNTYGSFLYIFVQNGFGTISEERSGEIARNRKRSCVRVAQVLYRDDARFVLCCWDSDFRRNLSNTIVSVGQRRSFFRITRCFDAVIAIEAAKCVEAICVSVSEFIVPEYRSAKSTRECDRMSDEIPRKRAKDGLILLLRYTFATLMS